MLKIAPNENSDVGTYSDLNLELNLEEYPTVKIQIPFTLTVE